MMASSRKMECIFLVLTLCNIGIIEAVYRIGVGLADFTGPAVGVVFMGYAKTSQKGTGIHLRQFARAFILEDEKNTRIAFVSVDVAVIGHGLRKEVLVKLKEKFGETYNEKNLIVSGTHTHSAPGGFLMDLLFDISTFGFVRETFRAYTSGITEAIIRAHKNMVEGKIFLNYGELLNANINRSPLAYLLNPKEERQKYQYDVDKEMQQLKFFASTDNKPLGVINWYPVHATSMNNTNLLISSDNVGYASILFENFINKGLPGKGPFVAAFASSNLGDVSPNIRGPHCINTGEPCDDVTSSCNGEAKYCVASGPGKDMFDSTKIIAERLYEKAKDFWLDTTNTREITGPLKIAHQFVNMSEQVAEFVFPNGTSTQVKGCLSAMGYSFAAGTTDGHGEFDFKQGTTTDNAIWNKVRNFLAKPTKEDIKCHHPKPILLNTGRIEYPYEWQPQIVSIQVAIIGDVILAAVPGEFTTMSGRRLKNTLQDVYLQNGGSRESKVIIAGLSNVYSDYIVTPEEYQLQRYEAASTIYGPHTLTLYLELYKNLITNLLKNVSIDAGPEPPDFSDKLISLISPVLFDWAGFKSDYGECVQQPASSVRPGDTVTAKFISGHPRNNVMHGKTFLTIEKMIDQDEWEVVANDASWETKFRWERTSAFLATSLAIVEWEVGPNTSPGTYRISHFGYYKYILGGTYPYQGISDNFKVL